MAPEERLLQMILDEIKSVKDAQTDFQKDVRSELESIRREMRDHARSVDKLEAKMAVIAALAAAAVTLVGHFVSKVFFSA